MDYNDIGSFINLRLEQENNKRQKLREEKYDDNYYMVYPSSLGRCTRSILYRMLDYQGKENNLPLNIFKMGDLIHEKIQEIFENSEDVFIANEMQFQSREYRISGKVDSVIKNIFKEEYTGEEVELYNIEYERKDGVFVLDDEYFKVIKKRELIYKGPSDGALFVEIKSSKGSGFNYINKTNSPKRSNLYQLVFYMYYFKVPNGVLIYENKNTQEYLEFYLELYGKDLKVYKLTGGPFEDKKLIMNEKNYCQKVLDQCKKIVEYKQKGKLPKREFKPYDFECRYCDYLDLCYPNENPYDLDDLMNKI